jgi:flagellar M-ring protein FliF
VSANYLNSRTVETYSGAIGNVRRITAAVLVNDKFDPNAAPGAQSQPRSPEELARIQALVQSAIGLDQNRGDVISVVSVPFDAPLPEAAEGMDVMMIVQEGWKPAIWILGLIFCFIIGLRTVRALQQPPVEAVVAALPSAEETLPELAPGEETEEETLTATEELIAQIMPPVDNTPTPGQALREQVVHRMDHQPETSLRLVRAWLKDS